MRVKNKEIRQRRHRKEQKVKEAAKAVRLEFADRKPTTPASKPKTGTAKKTPAKASADSKPKAPAKPKKAEGE